MKTKLKKWSLRIGATLALSFIILLTAVLYPSFSYANSTEIGDRLTIHHNQELAPELVDILMESYAIVEQAEIFDREFQINVCLNDGSRYPDLIRKIRGEAFAYGFANNTVVAVDIFPKENYAIWQGRKRILVELFAHEFIHNYQYNTYGFSSLNFPFWKLEGYCEYVMTRRNPDINLAEDIQVLLEAESKKMEDWDWIQYGEGFGTTPIYLRSRLMIQYLIEVKGKTYDQIVNDDSINEKELKEEMIQWASETN